MSIKYRISEVIGTMFYIGKIPFAPGTWGSLAALLLWYLIKPEIIDPLFLLITGGLFFVGISVSEIITRELKNHDPKEIVIDEWVGMWISLYLVPHSIFWGLISFLLFRFFDILKPGPVQIMDDIHSPIGVMLDDVVAGILALLVTQSLMYYM
jgi:phosphatidylglycerophosphatase A